MYSKLKYIILTILLLGIGFGIFSYLKIGEYNLHLFFLPLILVGITIIFFFLPRSLKMKSKLLTFSVLGISIAILIFSLTLTFAHFSNQRNYSHFLMMKDYYELSCEKMEERFHKDKKNNEIKFFHFNSFYVDSLKKELKKYGVTYYGMGSLYQENLNCYNKFVADYLKENIEIKNLVK